MMRTSLLLRIFLGVVIGVGAWALTSSRLSAARPIATTELLRVMAEAERRMGRLALVRAAGWRAPERDPDYDPLAEARAVTGLLRQASAESEGYPRQYQRLMRRAIDHADALAHAVADGKPAAQLHPLLARVAADCTACHDVYRD